MTITAATPICSNCTTDFGTAILVRRFDRVAICECCRLTLHREGAIKSAGQVDTYLWNR